MIRAPEVAGLALAALVCGSCKKKDDTSLVVGVQSDPMGGIVSALHVVIKVDGAVFDDETIRPPHGSKVGFPQPWEKTVPSNGSEKPKVEVEVDAIGDPNAPAPLIRRFASTEMIPGTQSLLRVNLESRCVVYPTVQRAPGSKVPGPLSGPTCTAPASCIMGVCAPPSVPPGKLEKYASNWPTNAPDFCKPAQGGAPILQVGTGQTYYLPMTENQTLQAEAGPQGGHHIWIATRMKNMKQSGTITKVAGVQPGTGATIPPTTLAFTYAPDEGGFCKLYGIRYQLDNEGVDYKQFLGKPLDVNVTVTDPAGATATATAHVQIAPTLLNP